ncbi:tetratricopeptide repeat protein [Xylanibacter ruminicola]|uniref:Tetratricopeptide repeat-containing protein n=1 Tax=Xylanibacter ruminicola TaxID=839 RepID=A0A1M6Z2Q1_XYLRU|nr:tetratricopeptide repeat protein [Xylanibacter ruminicola]SHL24814.1 Tetratricopeptide repeat-containing protein [Xylanibacter ruminicola]
MNNKKVIIGLLSLIILVAGIEVCKAPTPQNTNTEIKRIEDSIKNGKAETAKRIITQFMNEAKDSDMYYRWLSIQNRVWYAEMNVDSMTYVSERIHNYLIRHQNKQTHIRSLILAEWNKTKAVFLSAIQGRPDSALVYNEKAIKLLETLKDENELRLTALTNQAFFYRQVGRYDKSVEGYMNAIELADSIGKTEQEKTPLLLGISTVYTYMGDYERSEYWWNRSLEQLPHMIKADQFIYYNDRGNDYYFQQKYEKACECFAKAAQLVKDNEAKNWDYYTSLANLGEVYVCLNKTDSARATLQQADSFFHKVDFTPLLYYIETSNIKLEMQEGKTANALNMLTNSKIADPKIPSAKFQRLKAIKQIMSTAGKYKEAYEADQQLKHIVDSMVAANTSMQFSTRLIEYQHDKQLAEQKLTLEKAQSDKIIAWALFAVMLMVAIIIIGQFHLYRRRQRFNNLKTRQQIVMMRMESIRNRISPHFIYNALNHEVLAQMEGREIDLEALTQLLRRGIEQADILQTTLDEELSFVDYYISIEGRQMGSDFVYEKEVDSDVDVKKVNLPSMSIQIFAENALKHGLRPIKPTEGKQRKLLIKVSRQNQSTLVEVLDNGEGVQIAKKSGTLLGGRVMRQTIQLLNDNNEEKITFGINNWQQDEESGCRSWILLPDNYNYQITNKDE